MNSVYCAEFDSARIITGSRDRTIKIWSLKTGRCLATIKQHRGSVLCLKFEKDWDLDPNNAVTEPGLTDWRRGFMVSGSSDHNVCVWDLFACTTGGHERGGLDVTLTAELRGVLRGHRGGVLDLETNESWIVSWYVLSFSNMDHTTDVAAARRTPSYASGNDPHSRSSVRSTATRDPSTRLGSRATVS